MYQILGIILILTTISCKQREGYSDPAWETGGGHKRGHEDITRYGVELFRENCAKDSPFREYFPVIYKGVSGADTENGLVKGNFETDFPREEIFDFYNIRYGSGVDAWLKWHQDGEVQNIHALRNYGDVGVESIEKTCEGITQRIRGAVKRSLDELRSNRHQEVLFWLGHASHIVQDSFSQAHSKREGRDYKTITDYCTYGKEFEGICFHGDGDEDRIWKSSFSCQWDPNDRNWACFKEEAKQAAYATFGLLEVFSKISERGEDVFDEEMNEYFAGNTHPGFGFFNCNQIP